jgi:hypothetical protein
MMQVDIPSPRVTCFMPSRREDERAQQNWCRLQEAVDRAQHLDGVILDRTPSGGVARHLAKSGWNATKSRTSVQRQGPNAPLRAVWEALRGLAPDWLVILADDDEWFGLGQLTPPCRSNVSVLAPSLASLDTGSVVPALLPTSPLRPQHVLHGLLRQDVSGTISGYLSDAPTPWGGEDLLLVFVAESFGTVEHSRLFRYVWNSANWQGLQQDEVLRGYLLDAGWGPMADLSTYLLCQSLDRVAVTACARDQLSEKRWRDMVRSALERFWPVTDPSHHRIFKRLPVPVRRAVLESRGLAGLQRMALVARRTAAYCWGGTEPRSILDSYATGRHLVSSLGDIRSVLLPALRVAAPQAARAQIDYWTECVALVDAEYPR